jgi:iron-sulfur cluster repair protein YtfE (RIC family)
MEKRKPLKRKEEMKPVSRDHHHSLLLCWKIRTAFKKNVDVNRVKKYADWFYNQHILPHFELEEKYIFPVLGKNDELVSQALDEHRRLKSLFEDDEEPMKSLSLIEEELEKHIRFEERILFEKIQKIATERDLKAIELHHVSGNFEENTKDIFWK